MSADYFFAAKTIGLSRLGGRKPCTLLQAARHNLREGHAEAGSSANIDPGKSASNIIVDGPATAAEVVALADRVATAQGVDTSKLRRDHVQALEVVFSIPAGHDLDAIDHFKRCLAWTREAFGGMVVLSAVIHLDEAAPHLHVLLSPIRGGQHVGGKAIERAQLAQLRERFWQEVAGPAGLKRAGARLHGQSKRLAVDVVLARLRLDRDGALVSALWPLIRRAVEDNPLPHLEALGIDPNSLRPGEKSGSAKPIGFETSESKPIGFEGPPQKGGSLSCVGFARPEPRAAPTSTRMEIAKRAINHALHRQATRPPAPAEWEPQIITGDDGTCRIKDCPDPWAASNYH